MIRKKYTAILSVLFISLICLSSVFADGDADSTPGADLKLEKVKITIEPNIALASSIHYEKISPIANEPTGKVPDKTVATEKVGIFGIKGKVGDYVSYYTAIMYNMGIASYPTTSHGPHGTSVWEGNASLQLRDNFIGLARWGISLNAGIITDPGSVDFISDHSQDLLLADSNSRGFALYSGFNRGQGVVLNINWGELLKINEIKGLNTSFAYTSTNSGGMSGSSLVEGEFNNGIYPAFYMLANQAIQSDGRRYPKDGMLATIYNPSIRFNHKLFDVQAAWQFYKQYQDTADKDTSEISGNNIRIGARAKVPVGPLTIVPFYNMNWARTRVLDDPEAGVTFSHKVGNDYCRRNTIDTGLDINYGKHGIGLWYVKTSRDNTLEKYPARTELSFLNIGSSYYLNDNTSVHLRYGRIVQDIWAQGKNSSSKEETKNESVFLSLRLML